MEKIKFEGEAKGEFLDKLKKLDNVIIGIRSTLEFGKSEKIFYNFSEIKYHNMNSEINYNLCLNKIDLIIQELQILGVEKTIILPFFEFKCFILKNVTNKTVLDKIEKIIYL